MTQAAAAGFSDPLRRFSLGGHRSRRRAASAAELAGTRNAQHPNQIETSEDEMKNKPYIVLVGVDFSLLSDRALEEAFKLASQHKNAEVHVLSALPVASSDPGYAVSVYVAVDDTSILDQAIDRLQKHVQERFEQFVAAQQGMNTAFLVVSHARVDAAAHALVQLASDLGADLIVVGTHNPKGVERFLLGSVAEGTVRDARCPVLVIPAPPEPDASTVITPPCPDCVQTRAASSGKELWCAQHAERHGRRHTYHQADRSGAGSNFPLVYR
jgi:nucleotide-binding universal stress UspA family protein